MSNQAEQAGGVGAHIDRCFADLDRRVTAIERGFVDLKSSPCINPEAVLCYFRGTPITPAWIEKMLKLEHAAFDVAALSWNYSECWPTSEDKSRLGDLKRFARELAEIIKGRC